MKIRGFISIVVFLVLCVCMGCTDQNMAKNWGGKATLDLPKGYKLVNMTWKEDNLWYLVRPMKDGDSAEEYLFKENSSLGMLQGEIKVRESK